MIGLAWSVAAIFAIPILIAQPEISNPFTILGKSATTLKRTWGEMLAGYIGMSGINLLVLWFSILSWVGTGALAIGLRNPWLLLLYGVLAGRNCCLFVRGQYREQGLPMRPVYLC